MSGATRSIEAKASSISVIDDQKVLSCLRRFPNVPVGLDFDKCADGRQLDELGVVIKEQFRVVTAAGRKLQVAHHGRPVARLVGEGKRRDGVKRGEDVSLSRDQCAAERRIEIMFLGYAPGDKLLGRGVALFAE